MPDYLQTASDFEIYLNGAKLEEKQLNAVESVSVNLELNVPAMFTIQMRMLDVFDKTWQGVDLKMFQLGDEIKIMMGSESLEIIVIGEITGLEPTFDSPAYLEIRGYDRLHRLRFGTFRRSFVEMTDSQIVSEIVSGLSGGLSAKVEDSKTKTPYLFQNNQTNYDFLLARAERIGFEMLADDKSIVFGKSKEDQKAAVTLTYGDNLTRFSAQLNALTQGSKVEVTGWDLTKKEVIASSATSGSEISKMAASSSGLDLSKKAFGESIVAVTDDAIIDVNEAELVAVAKYNVLLNQFLTGSGSCPGNPLIKTGITVEIEGLGDRFSGTYYVTSATHSFVRDSGYQTKFKVRRTGV